ncbi:MAG: type II toxin-antitoxin system RelE/ParE family toxin [Candidatus Fervidibacter sacchari]
MGKFEVKFHRNAAKAYQRLPKAVKQRIDEAIETLRTNPFYGKDICKLSGKLEGLYRLRIGEYRVIYRILEEQRLVIVEAVGTRGEVY